MSIHRPCSLCGKGFSSETVKEVCPSCVRAVKNQEALKRLRRNERVKELLRQRVENHDKYMKENARINEELAKLGRRC